MRPRCMYVRRTKADVSSSFQQEQTRNRFEVKADFKGAGSRGHTDTHGHIHGRLHRDRIVFQSRLLSATPRRAITATIAAVCLLRFSSLLADYRGDSCDVGIGERTLINPLRFLWHGLLNFSARLEGAERRLEERKKRRRMEGEAKYDCIIILLLH